MHHHPPLSNVGSWCRREPEVKHLLCPGRPFGRRQGRNDGHPRAHGNWPSSNRTRTCPDATYCGCPWCEGFSCVRLKISRVRSLLCAPDNDIDTGVHLEFHQDFLLYDGPSNSRETAGPSLSTPPSGPHAGDAGERKSGENTWSWLHGTAKVDVVRKRFLEISEVGLMEGRAGADEAQKLVARYSIFDS